MIRLFSRRNEVFLTQWDGQDVAEKHFRSTDHWRHEYELYRTIPLAHPTLIHAEPGLIVTQYLPFPTLLGELERQEAEGFSPEPWHALAEWLTQCGQLTGMLPSEGNLRNFLWDAELGQIYGLDFESYCSIPLSQCGSLIIAALLEYRPADTMVKKQAAELLALRWSVSHQTIHDARADLRTRRAAKTVPPDQCP